MEDSTASPRPASFRSTTSSGPPTAAWKRSLADAIRDPDELVTALRLPEACREPARRAAASFPLVVPRELLGRMRLGDPDDPILRQVLPLDRELASPPGYGSDPLDEAGAETAPGLLHKYRGRALLIAAGHCAVNCRYCFRRSYPYDEAPRGQEAWRPALDELRRSPEIQEAILSGGDPLVLTDASLSRLADELAAIPSLERLRVHTRLPIVIPSRVDDALLASLRGTRLTPVVVVHANHPAEIDADCGAALERLVDAGIPTLCQSVLLRGVNDDAATLAELCERLIARRVIPYYLHQLDRVNGAAHFEVPVEEGRRIHARLRELLPGYAVPRYVREEPGAAHKLEVGPG